MRALRLAALLVLVAVLVGAYFYWSGIINLMLPADNRPAVIEFAAELVTPERFESIVAELNELPAHYGAAGVAFPHVDRFRQKGILAYEGSKTCRTCHTTITVTDAETGGEKKVDLMKNVLSSAHYLFFTKRHPNVYGFNGKLADNFPMGKIDRPCPKPGSLAITAWAELITTEDGKTYSEGCGQCHIGGQYQAPLGELMPGYRTLAVERDAIDCLICHAVAYDMNKKQVVRDANGRLRWGQDRSLKAAMSAVRPTAQNCLRCHQHNFGGDIYVDDLDASFMQSLVSVGTDKPRVRHPGSKRGTPYSPTWDVHAAAGLPCIDCHTTEGHLIAKGTHTTTMMANDLPRVEVTCEQCHTGSPHQSDTEIAYFLNGHTEKLACVTCHIPSLHPDNVTMRDFSSTVFEEEVGIYIYDDVLKETEAGKAIVYVWWNGDGTFLGNPIGDNPNGKNLYTFYKPSHVWPEHSCFDYTAWYENVMRPIAQKGGASKLYAIKRYNGKQHIDLQNMTPFGGMFLPYNFPVYYTTGDAGRAAQAEAKKSMMKMMYGWMFDVYLMNKFMTFMDAAGWNTGAYRDVLSLNRVEARWIPQDASMEISHAVRREGALTCDRCHDAGGVINWNELGYSDVQVQTLKARRVVN